MAQKLGQFGQKCIKSVKKNAFRKAFFSWSQPSKLKKKLNHLFVLCHPVYNSEDFPPVFPFLNNLFGCDQLKKALRKAFFLPI